MKKSIIATLMLFCFFPKYGVADPISVKSGDHDGFTRLVMRLPAEVQWEIAGTPGMSVISVLGHDDGFDIGRVFNIIPRDQLLNITAYPSRLELSLSCDCEIRSFVEQGSFLVVDVIDGSPLPLTKERDSSFVNLRPQSSFGFGELLWSGSEGPTDQELLSDSRQATQVHHGEGTHQLVATQEADVVNTTRDRLARGIANAAARGLVQPSSKPIDLPGLQKKEKISPSIEIFDSSTEIPLGNQNELSNLRITNSSDMPNGHGKPDQSTSSSHCVDANAVQIAGWGNEQSFHQQVSVYRDELYSDTDQLNDSAALNLARLYLYFGFGAEAKQTLSLSNQLLQSNPALMDISDIVDFGYARNPRYVHQFADCDTDLSLWAIVAARKISKNKAVNENAALRALAKLPPGLRDYVAPILSQRFTELGRTDAASIALRQVNPSEALKAAAANLARAKIKQTNGKVAISDQILTTVSGTNTPESPEALIAYVQNRMTDLSPVTADISLLIESHAFERKNSLLGPELFRTHALASALSGQYRKAFILLEDPIAAATRAKRSELQSQLFAILTKSSDDIQFLDLVFEYFPFDAGGMFSDSIFGTAKRMKGLGFATAAMDILKTIPEASRDEQTTTLRAEIFLDLGQPDKALDALQNVTGRTVDVLRAQSYLAMGDDSRAVELFEAADEAQLANRTAWLSDDWLRTISEQSDQFAEIRDLAKTPLPQIEAEFGMMTRTQDALEKSEEARDTVERMLGNIQVTP